MLSKFLCEHLVAWGKSFGVCPQMGNKPRMANVGSVCKVQNIHGDSFFVIFGFIEDNFSSILHFVPFLTTMVWEKGYGVAHRM